MVVVDFEVGKKGDDCRGRIFWIMMASCIACILTFITIEFTVTIKRYTIVLKCTSPSVQSAARENTSTTIQT